MAQLTTGYAVLKDLFDALSTGNGCPIKYDNITNIYRDAFGETVSYLPKYIFILKVLNNPINRVIVFGGQSETKILSGVIPSTSGIDYITTIAKRFEYGLTVDNIEDYIEYVFNTISHIISKDRLIGCGPREPYGIFLRACPFYLTFHHIVTVASNLLNIISEDVFNKYISQFVANEDDVATVLQSISGEEYEPTFEEICRVMTVNNTVEFK